MGDRTPFVVGILAIVGVVAWLVLRDERARPADSQPAPSAPANARATVAAPEAPSLGSAAPAPALPPSTGPTAEDLFFDEVRDAAWAERTEAEITKRWAQVRGGKLESTECRQTQCRLVVTGAQDDVATAIADLEGPRGLHGFAENILLTNPARNADGSVVLRLYARFDR